MTEREALQLSLEALEYPGNIWHMDCPKDKAITAIREALAQPEQEPVIGTKTWFEDGKVVTQHLTAKDIYKEPEPVIDKSAAIRIATSLGWEPKRKPLTDEEIGKIAGETLDPWSCARAIEAAHGIKENNT